MEGSLSNSAQRIQEALERLKLNLQVVELPETTRTAQDAAQAIGCSVGQIAKSLIFKTIITERPVLVIASGSNLVDEKLLGKMVGEKIIKADADFVRQHTGFSIGGVPPIGHIEKIDTYIDQDLLTHEEIWAAAGTPNAVFRILSGTLVKLSLGKVVPVNS